MNKLTNIKYYKKEHVKALYAKFGRDSGLNPGVMWPRREELQHLKQYEQAFCPPLEDLINENNSKKQEAAQRRLKREKEVYSNLQKLPAEFKKFFDKIEAKEREKEAWLRERELQIEEVREFLGYRAKPTDERFQKALAQKQEEELKAKRKEARKKRENASLDELLAPKEDKE